MISFIILGKKSFLCDQNLREESPEKLIFLHLNYHSNLSYHTTQNRMNLTPMPVY